MIEKRAADLRPGDVVTGQSGEPFYRGPYTVNYLADRHRGGVRKGLRIHWVEHRRVAALDCQDDTLMMVMEGDR